MIEWVMIPAMLALELAAVLFLLAILGCAWVLARDASGRSNPKP